MAIGCQPPFIQGGSGPPGPPGPPAPLPNRQINYVSKLGSDSAGGLHPDDSLLTLQEAVNRAQVNFFPIVVMDAGTYQEDVLVTSFVNQIDARHATIFGSIEFRATFQRLRVNRILWDPGSANPWCLRCGDAGGAFNCRIDVSIIGGATTSAGNTKAIELDTTVTTSNIYLHAEEVFIPDNGIGIHLISGQLHFNLRRMGASQVNNTGIGIQSDSAAGAHGFVGFFRGYGPEAYLKTGNQDALLACVYGRMELEPGLVDTGLSRYDRFPGSRLFAVSTEGNNPSKRDRQILYVSKYGTDFNTSGPTGNVNTMPGSISAPFQSIGAAITVIGNLTLQAGFRGWLIEVLDAGLYEEDVTLPNDTFLKASGAVIAGKLTFGRDCHAVIRGLEFDDATETEAILFNPPGVFNCCSLKATYLNTDVAAVALTSIIKVQGSAGETLDLDIDSVVDNAGVWLLDVDSAVKVQGKIRSAQGVAGSNGLRTSTGCICVDLQDLDLPTGSNAFDTTNVIGEIASYVNKLTCGTVHGPTAVGIFNYNALRETLI